MSSMSLNNFPKQGLPNSGIDQNGPQSRMVLALLFMGNFGLL